MPLNTLDEVVSVLDWFGSKELTESLLWRCDGQYAPITVMVICNDLFYWATAEAEDVTAEDVPLLEQAWQDCHAACSECDVEVWVCSLFAARKRGMRPQGAAYPRCTRLHPLFSAAGPERPTDNMLFGNPRQPLDVATEHVWEVYDPPYGPHPHNPALEALATLAPSVASDEQGKGSGSVKPFPHGTTWKEPRFSAHTDETGVMPEEV